MRIMVFFFVLCCYSFNLYAQNWKKIEDFPGVERDDGASFIIGDKVYAGSGVVPFTPLRDFYSFDFKSESWTSIASLPIYQGRQYSAAFASSQYGFLFGGISNQFLNDLWRYNPATDQWQQMSSLNARGRGGFAVFVIDSFAYIVAGKTQDEQAINEVWAYNMYKDQWIRKGDMPFGKRWRSGATVFQGKGYLVFGLDDTLRYCPEVYEYNPSSDQWSLFSNFPNGGRNYVRAHTINNSLIVIGGQDSAANFLNECWKLDYLTKVWESTTALPSLGRRGGISFTDSTSIYYTTGLGDSGKRFVETWKFENPTSLFEFQTRNSWVVYPNPAKDWIEVKTLFNPERIELYNLKSELILRKEMNGRYQMRISLENLKPGLYIIILDTGKQRFTKKIVVY